MEEVHGMRSVCGAGEPGVRWSFHVSLGASSFQQMGVFTNLEAHQILEISSLSLPSFPP